MSLRRPLAIALVPSVALAGLVTVAATGASGAPPTNVQPRAAVTNTSVLTTVKTLVTVGKATGIAVDAADDTIYVSDDTGNVYTINGATLVQVRRAQPTGLPIPIADVAVNQVDDKVYVVSNSATPTLEELSGSTGLPVAGVNLVGAGVGYQVAVNQVDDTVYVTFQESAGAQPASLNVFRGADRSRTTLALPNGSDPRGVAVNDQDDTVYVALRDDTTLSRINGVTDDSQTTLVGSAPWGVGVNQGDDTVYVMNNTSGTLSVINGATGAVSRTVPLSAVTSTTATGVAVDQVDDTVYVTDANAARLWILNGGNLDDSTTVKTRGIPKDVAVDDTGGSVQGLVYVATDLGLEVVARATPVLNGLTTTGAAGATVTVDVTTTPTPSYAVDSNMVFSLRFDGSTSALASPGPGAGQWSAVLPSGLPTGPVTVEAVFRGGNIALAGTYTVQSPTPPPPPPPPPLYPPGPPTNVTAVAGDAQATVSWVPPTSVGASPIIEYEVRSAPGYWSCRVNAPATSCTVTGLTNGVSYTFTVEARNGDGWGSDSSPSNAVTPKPPSILITGSRDSADSRFIRVQGTTTDLVGKQVTPYVRFPGEAAYTAGVGVQTVAADGTFAWSRKTGKKISVYFVNANVRSNTVVITAR